MEIGKNFGERIIRLRASLEKKEFAVNEEKIVENLKILLENSVKKRLSGRVGVAFSGGLDSTLIAFLISKLNYKFKLYCVGLQNSKDLEWAQRIAAKMHWPIEFKLVSLEEADETIRKVVKLIPIKDVVNVGVGCVLYHALKMAKEDSVDFLFSGLGAEELFAGYAKHTDYGKDFTRITEKCWEGLENLWETNLQRDVALAKHFNIKVSCPFLDTELIKYAMLIHPSLKVDKETKKIILRKAALSFGLPKEFVWRKRAAAQYGSNFDKALLKLAKKEGTRYKKEYLKKI